jgi:translation initiation factor 5
MQNIGAGDEDQFFRYKMPSIVARNESRGNGAKVAILNIIEVAKSLDRDPEEVGKFLQIDLSTSKTWKPKENRLILKGSFEQRDLSDSLEKYIQHFVLCDGCGLPETTYRAGKRLKKKCAACGFKSAIEATDKSLEKMIKHMLK